MIAHLLAVREVLCYGSVEQLRDVLFLCHTCQGVLQDMRLQHRLSLACIEHPAGAWSHFWPASVVFRLGIFVLSRSVYRDQVENIPSSLANAMLNSDLSHLLRASWMASLCCVIALCRSSCALSSGDLWAAAMLPVIRTEERSSECARLLAYHHFENDSYMSYIGVYQISRYECEDSYQRLLAFRARHRVERSTRLYKLTFVAQLCHRRAIP